MIDGPSFSPAAAGLQRGFRMLNASTERLATGHAINRGADGPAALVTSENLRSMLAMLDAESRALGRTSQVATVADAALGEVSDLLVEARGIAVAASSDFISDDERAALQMEMDSIVSTVDRLSGGATFNGDALFDGETELSASGTSVALESMSSGDLNISDLGSSVGNGSAGMSAALEQIEAAAGRVSTMRGEIGAFERHAVSARRDSLAVEMENVAAAESQIRDTDYASEISAAIRAEIQVQASISMLKVEQNLATRVVDLLG